MGKKQETVWVCQTCGGESLKWMGRCPHCGAFGTMVEETVRPEPAPDQARRRGAAGGGGGSSRPSPLARVGSAGRERFSTGIGELDRVLGGGLVKGSLTLISGEPGIGKSTLIMQAAANIARGQGKVLYVSGEESGEQIKLRADRILGGIPEELYVMCETSIDRVVQEAESMMPAFLIVDSIQTMFTDALTSAPGSVSQVRACGNLLMGIGKNKGIPVFIVCHVTKSGDLAGPKILEHLVDAVLNFTGERDHEIRILRAYKNRFGTTSEIGAFQMEERGLVEVENLSASFLEGADEGAEGSVITAVYEGSRPVFLEIQALASRTAAGFPRRTAVGVDYQRLSMILAVLEKRAGLQLSNEDVYVNVVGGLRPDSTSVDLGVALAVYSSVRGASPSARVVAVGEVGLTGGLRSIRNADRIAQEAARLGYDEVIMPRGNAARAAKELAGAGLRIVGCRDLSEAIRAFRAAAGRREPAASRNGQAAGRGGQV